MGNRRERSTTPQMTAWIVGALIFISCAVLALMFIPDFLVTWSSGGDTSKLSVPEKVKAVTDARQDVLLGVGGVIAVVTLLFTRAKHILEREKQSLDQDANWTSRYTEAIAQLGDESSISIRLGGIYALERIAQDSQRDRQTVLEVLCAYLREKCPVTTKPGEKAALMETDTAAAAAVVGRITQLSRPTNEVNLKNTTLTGADLNCADLTRANLTGAILSFANLTNAKLTYADLTNADLTNADLTNADLTNADLPDADLTEADLTEADLTDADLTNADLTNAIFTDADLTHARLMGANLTDAILIETNLTDAIGTDGP